MSGVGGLMSTVLLPNQTHKKNQNPIPKDMCLLFGALSSMSWSVGGITHCSVTERSAQMEMGIGLRNNLNRVVFTCQASLTLKSTPICSSEHSSCRHIFSCSARTRLKIGTHSFIFALYSIFSLFHQTFL